MPERPVHILGPIKTLAVRISASSVLLLRPEPKIKLLFLAIGWLDGILQSPVLRLTLTQLNTNCDQLFAPRDQQLQLLTDFELRQTALHRAVNAKAVDRDHFVSDV